MLFSKQGLKKLFQKIQSGGIKFSANAEKMLVLQDDYINSIDAVVAFLQDKDATLAHSICKREMLPEASRFEHTDDLEKAFGNMGIQDRAKYIATMYLEDLSDLIKETVDEHFGFSRYAEKLGRSANSFDELYNELKKPFTFIDELLIELLAEKMKILQPKMVALSVPFPGNLYTSLRCGQWLKSNYPDVKILMGGGFANTELRSLTDKRVFEFYDFITLDDGEAPIENLIAYIKDYSIYQMNLETGSKEIVYQGKRKKKVMNFRWSPDGDFLMIHIKGYLLNIESGMTSKPANIYLSMKDKSESSIFYHDERIQTWKKTRTK